MKKVCILILLFLTIFVHKTYTQETVKKIELHICPLYIQTAVSIERKKLKHYVEMKISFERSMLKMSNDDFWWLVSELEKYNKEEEIGASYYIKCIIHKRRGGKEVLYFNSFGDFWYKGKTYKNNTIKSFIFAHIPERAKD